MDEDFNNAERKLASIDGLLSNWKLDIATRAPKLQNNLNLLADKLIVPAAASQDSHLGRMRAQFTDLFEKLNGIKTAPPTINEANFLELDTLAFRLSLIADFVAASNLQDPKNYDDTVVTAARNKLADQLKRSGWQALRTAQNLTIQMGERISYQDIKKALTEKRLIIKTNRSEIWPFDPTRFSLEFYNPALNCCAAREEWKPVWNFGHSSDLSANSAEAYLKESAWTVSHFFPDSRTYTVSVTFRHPNDGTLLDSKGQPLAISEEVPVCGSGGKKAVAYLQRSRAGKLLTKGWQNLPALFELLLVLLPALLGLIAGAKDQLLKMDLFPALAAMWLIGFQSDQIKNLLSPAKKS